MPKLKGKWVFMNFTAKWCFTCKVNEQLVFSTDAFKNFAKEKNLVLLQGDWTKRDQAITTFLEQHERFGVPSYFLQNPDGQIISLGETISIGKITELMNKGLSK